MLFFFAYKGPFLIKLHLIGLRGKTLPTHREAPLRARRQQGYTVLPYLDVRLQIPSGAVFSAEQAQGEPAGMIVGLQVLWAAGILF
jgi:hypothetical protein